MPAKTKTRSKAGHRPGTCWICGCTQDRACPGGCAWANLQRTVCTSCSIVIGGAISTAIMGILIERAGKEPQRTNLHQNEPRRST